jgi:ABC-type nitrate/sulfonate/bicarbonate transport system substrate-binding protein
MMPRHLMAVSSGIRGQALLTAALLLAIGLATACARAPSAPPEATGGEVARPQELRVVRYGNIGKALAHLPLVVADQTGLWAQEGLRIEPTYFNSAALATTALSTGEVDYIDGLPTGVRAAIQGFPVKAVVALERAATYSLVGRPEIRTVADLAGAKLGTSRINSGDYYVFADLLARHGLNPASDVVWVSVGGTDARFTALVNGAIDATLLNPPANFLAEKERMRTLVNPDGLLTYPVGGMATTEQKLATQREEVRAMLRAYVKALEVIHSDQNRTVAIIRDYFEMDAENALATYRFAQVTLGRDGTPPPEAVRAILETERATLELPHELPPSTGLDLSVLEEVQRELGKR